MLSLDDCVCLSDLDEGEIAAIAEHEHISLMVAAELGHCLMGDAAGRRRIAAMLRDDIATAQRSGAARHLAELTAALATFLHDNPDARPQA